MQLREAADVLGVHYQTAYGWVRQGVLPARKTARGYEVSDSDVSALAERRAAGTAPPPQIRVRDWAAQADRLHAAIVSGDETAARQVFTRLARGVPITDLCERVIAPALNQIGADWAAGNLNIATEHRASAICERLIAARARQPQGRPRGIAVTTTPPGERHALPALMATACLREDRWLVHHLAADVPVAEVVSLALDTGVTLVVLSAATAEGARLAQQAAEEITLTAPGLRVLADQPGHPLSQLRESARATVADTSRLLLVNGPCDEPAGERRDLITLLGQVQRGRRHDQAGDSLGGEVVDVRPGHVDRYPARVLQRVGGSARGPRGRPHQVELAGPLGRGDPATREVAVSAQASPPGRGPAGSPDVNRERALGVGAVGFGEAAQVGEGEEVPVEADAVLVPRPQQPQHVDRLVGAAAAGGEVDADRRGLARQRSDPDGEQPHPALGQHVDRRHPVVLASRLASTTGW